MVRRIDPDSRWWHLPTPLGFVLLIAGLGVLTSARVAMLVVAGILLVCALLVGLAWVRRRRSGRPVRLTAEEEATDWQRFVANRGRWAPLESVLYVLLAGVLVWTEGLRVGTILIAAGLGCLLISRWLIEPRIWAEAGQRMPGG